MEVYPFVAVALVIAGTIHYGGKALETYLAKKKYRKEREVFAREVASGKSPEHAPRLILPSGKWSTDPNDLIRTAGFRRQVALIQKMRTDGVFDQ